MSRGEFLEYQTEGGYSSNVQLFLVAEERAYPLAQIGPDYVVLRKPVEIPPGEAEVVMRVDGEERRWSVILPYGAVPFDTEVHTADR